MLTRLAWSFVVIVGVAAIARVPAAAQPACPPAPIIGAIADACDRTCLYADAANKYAIEIDIGPGKEASYLLVSTDCFNTGIESKALLTTAPKIHYFAQAWSAAKKLMTPVPAWIGLAVNAANQDAAGNDLSRTQRRLHVHISCVKREVIAQLTRKASAFMSANTPGTSFAFDFAPLPSLANPMPSKVSYDVFPLDREIADDPIADIPAGADWRNVTLAVVGRSDGTRSFVLVGHPPAGADPSKVAISSEDLLQQTCATPAFGA